MFRLLGTLRSATRGFGEARVDSVFARVAGSFFGGLDLRPLPALGLMWSKNIGYLGEGGAKMFFDFLGGGVDRSTGLRADFAAWRRGWWRSLIDDPLWHGRWMADVTKKSARLQATLWTSDNPRGRGVIPIV